MRLTILQRDIVWASPRQNRRLNDEVIARLPATDLIVLPEMFSTGFATRPAGIAEPEDSPTLAWMKAVAHERDCALAGSLAVQTRQGQFVNRFYFVTPDGREVHYDKHHLFTYGGEHLQFTAGRERVSVTWRGVRIRLLVCYDLRFPAWCRNTDDYDLALFVASWPTSRVDAWDTLLRARAIENQCYVAGVNRVGADPLCAYPGSSAIIDAYGRVLAGPGRDVEGVATAEVDLEWLSAFRQKFPVLRDADPLQL